MASSSSSGSGDSSSGSGSLAGSTYDTIFDWRFAARTSDEDGEDTTTVDDEYCRYNASETEKSGCKKPRDCRSCLRVTGCMVDADAQCVSAALHVNQSNDFRGATLYQNASLLLQSSTDYWNSSGAYSDAVQNWTFPSTFVEYCPENEPTCTICRLSVFTNTTRTGGDMRFCVAKSGCVCMARCDNPQHYDEIRGNTTCDPSKAPAKGEAQALMWVVGACIAIVICSGLYYWMWRRTGVKGEEEENMEIIYGKDRSTDKPAAPVTQTHGPPPDTPVMELSLSEYPRFSIDSSRRRPPQSLVVNLQGELE